MAIFSRCLRADVVGIGWGKKTARFPDEVFVTTRFFATRFFQMPADVVGIEGGQELAPPTEELGLAKLVHWPSRWLGIMTKGHWLGRKRSGT
jgi:hypothetical protein